MQFNPYTVGTKPTAPNVGAGDVTNLLRLQQGQLGGAVDALKRMGQASRASDVNDLIARGGLEGLTEQQAKSLITEVAGGTVTPESQKSIDQLLSGIRAGEEREFKAKEAETERGFKESEAKRGREFESTEKAKQRGFESTEAKKKARALEVSQDLDRMLKGNIADEQLALEKLKLSAAKPDGLSKGGVKKLLEADDPLAKAVVDIDSYLNEVDDNFFNQKMDDKTKRAVRESVYQSLQTPEGQRAYAIGGSQELYNKVKKDMTKAGLEFDDEFNISGLIPFTDTPLWSRTLK